MDNKTRYEEAVHQLTECSYKVTPRKQIYVVRHLLDRNDVLHARHIDDLVDLAKLMKWRREKYLN